MNHINGLNGLRAIAVILVIIEHWFPANHILKSFPLGGIGVDIFFVLSGFLISRILLNKRESIGETFKEKIGAIKGFIIRRTLRIFPIYYLLLLVLYFTNGPEIKQGFVYYLTYTSNYFFYDTQEWHGMMAHLWSLAVEEQFYLVWPLLLLFILRKHFVKLFLFSILIGTIFPFFCSNYMSYILTLSCINAFGLGAFFAYVEVYKPEFSNQFKKTIKYTFLPLILFVLLQYTVLYIKVFPIRLIVAVITLNCIRICLENNPKNLLFAILNTRVLNFIGMISYGVYLYHCPLPSYWRRFFRMFKVESPFDNSGINYYELSAQFLLLLFISYLSWIIVEKPILKFKKSF
ncbi:acyltransferase [Flavobacterium amnicola]|uniref:Acyltransferase n=1 Tax=Flavobacterium amnicola TaxID=2506422 RepID=A0A4Q1K1F4_9FLAO|nr:acyltransferase [Flavobacterium amnicola]RXR17756.1 acyltransferase [Flavobacterium amnicola]